MRPLVICPLRPKYPNRLTETSPRNTANTRLLAIDNARVPRTYWANNSAIDVAAIGIALKNSTRFSFNSMVAATSNRYKLTTRMNSPPGSPSSNGVEMMKRRMKTSRTIERCSCVKTLRNVSPAQSEFVSLSPVTSTPGFAAPAEDRSKLLENHRRSADTLPL